MHHFFSDVRVGIARVYLLFVASTRELAVATYSSDVQALIHT